MDCRYRSIDKTGTDIIPDYFSLLSVLLNSRISFLRLFSPLFLDYILDATLGWLVINIDYSLIYILEASANLVKSISNLRTRYIVFILSTIMSLKYVRGSNLREFLLYIGILLCFLIYFNASYLTLSTSYRLLGSTKRVYSIR